MQNSLLASNSGGNCSGVILDQGHNLSFAGAGCPATFAGGDPNLGPLDDNGGPSRTVSLGVGSAALDKIPPSGAGCQSTDQRGVPRPVGSGCDIGAYEVAGPKASTAPPTGVGSTGATLNGSVTPNAGSATVEFDYGTSTKYGSKATQTLGGVVATPVLAKLSRLKPKTVYHFRIIVTAMDGTATTADRTFMTSPPPILSKLKIKPAAFRAGGRGATISYSDSEPAKVTFVVLRQPAASSAAAVRRTAEDRTRRRRRCTRFVAVGRFTHRQARRQQLALQRQARCAQARARQLPATGIWARQWADRKDLSVAFRITG